jgi:hypothetical protein
MNRPVSGDAGYAKTCSLLQRHALGNSASDET